MVFSAIWRYLASPATALTAKRMSVGCAENASVPLTLIQHLRHIDWLDSRLLEKCCRKEMKAHSLAYSASFLYMGKASIYCIIVHSHLRRLILKYSMVSYCIWRRPEVHLRFSVRWHNTSLTIGRCISSRLNLLDDVTSLVTVHDDDGGVNFCFRSDIRPLPSPIPLPAAAESNQIKPGDRLAGRAEAIASLLIIYYLIRGRNYSLWPPAVFLGSWYFMVWKRRAGQCYHSQGSSVTLCYKA